jgi:TolA-binding protein
VLTPQGAAAFTRISSRPDEVVTLTTGSLSVEVSPLRRGERFRIVTSDAEVEVLGTAFEVTADRGTLVAVHVWHGRVEVRPSAGGAVVLGGGESWARPALTAGASSVTPAAPIIRPASPAGDVRVDSPSAKPEKERPMPANTSVVGQRKTANKPGAEPVPGDHVADAGALAYQEAWSALRAGDHASAAKGFERAATVAPRSALAEDAWYWRAVSLARSKQSAEARAAFASFLEKYQGSPRVPQASAMLGWLLFEAADLDGAEVRFRAAASDADPAIRDSAQKGLDAIRRRRSETK